MTGMKEIDLRPTNAILNKALTRFVSSFCCARPAKVAGTTITLSPAF